MSLTSYMRHINSIHQEDGLPCLEYDELPEYLQLLIKDMLDIKQQFWNVLRTNIVRGNLAVHFTRLYTAVEIEIRMIKTEIKQARQNVLQLQYVERDQEDRFVKYIHFLLAKNCEYMNMYMATRDIGYIQKIGVNDWPIQRLIKALAERTLYCETLAMEDGEEFTEFMDTFGNLAVDPVDRS
uniref:Uncharacterized protein LOC114339318 n=1 Tax=Diabrotica virgifera virgifera TaxID=50390 RepID=A0A6P7GPR0_DIAVI